MLTRVGAAFLCALAVVASLPVRIDKKTRWVGVMAGADEMIYRYRLADQRDRMDLPTWRRRQKARLVDNACSFDPEKGWRVFLDNGISVDIVYYDRSGALVERFNLPSGLCE